MLDLSHFHLFFHLPGPAPRVTKRAADCRLRARQIRSWISSTEALSTNFRHLVEDALCEEPLRLKEPR